MEDALAGQVGSESVLEVRERQGDASSGLSSSSERLPDSSATVAEGTLGGRTVIPNYGAQINARTDQQTKLQNEVGETSRKIIELKSSRISTGKIIKWGILAAVAVGGLVGVVAGVLAAPLTCCIVMGVLVGVLVGVATSYALHKGNCDRQAQIELLGQLQNAQGGLREANEGLIGAYGDLQTAMAELAEQQGTIGEQRTTIAEQQNLVTEQTTQIENFRQQNTELQRNLEVVEEARAAAERQVAEIQASSTQLQSALTDIQDKITANEAEIERLRQTNTEQANALQKQTDAMKAFVDQQQKMVSDLETTVRENQGCLDGMLEKVQAGGGNVQGSIEQIKTYVKNEFDAVQRDLAEATSKLSSCKTMEDFLGAQKTVNEAILKGTARAGTMQAYIIGALTKLQMEIQKQQEEMVAAIDILRQNHGKAVGNIRQLKNKYNAVQTQLEQYHKRIKEAIIKATQLGEQAGKNEKDKEKIRQAVQSIMAKTQKLNQQAASLEKNLAEMGTNLEKIQGEAATIEATCGELQEKQRQLGTNCETLQQQNQALQESNDKLFGHAQRIGENLGVIGAGIDQAAAGISGAVAAVDGATSRWSRFGAILGAGVGGAGAAAVGAGALTIGAAAAAGVVLVPLVSVLAVGYMAGATRKCIDAAKTKASSLADSIGSIALVSINIIKTIGTDTANLLSQASLLNRVQPTFTPEEVDRYSTAILNI